MSDGTVLAICISPLAGAPMRLVDEALALAGLGLEGDRYASGDGSWNKGRPGKSQVTLINGLFFPGSGFDHAESRRNIVTRGVELMGLIGKEFTVGAAKLRGVRYCDPCLRPSALAGKTVSFKEAFHDRGGLVAEVLEGGLIKVGDAVVPPPKKR